MSSIQTMQTLCNCHSYMVGGALLPFAEMNMSCFPLLIFEGNRIHYWTIYVLIYSRGLKQMEEFVPV